jgi:hypothetical protein
MSAVHDSTICVTCGRFGSTDERMRNECRVFYLLAAGMWINRPEGSFGREARAIANILHAGAKLRIDSQNEVMRRLFDEAMRLSDGFDAQGMLQMPSGQLLLWHWKMLVWSMHWQELALIE